MNDRWVALIDDISRLPANWHAAGSVSPAVLHGIARHAERIGAIQSSAETGSGKSTLLFSHLSQSHLVFAMDAGNGSVIQAKASPLLNRSAVTFVEGPTQLTLPRHTFAHPLQMVLLDGPHGYPFPDLEYYYFYPHIVGGGLLILDDIQIPSIGRMYDIIKAGDMFRPHEVIENTAFLVRTDAPLIHPESDGWSLQGYNRAYYEQMIAASPQSPGDTKQARSGAAEAQAGPQPRPPWWKRILSH